MRTHTTLLALVTSLASGCGYEFAYRAGEDGGESVQSVAIEIVENATFRQGFEAELTRAIATAIQDRTPFTIRSRAAADAVLEVRIRSIDGRVIIAAGGGNPVREGSLEFAVTTRLRHLRTGRLLRDEAIVDRAEFASPIGETERSARDEAMMDLGRKIALALEPDF